MHEWCYVVLGRLYCVMTSHKPYYVILCSATLYCTVLYSQLYVDVCIEIIM